jgi:hypothetical protein
MTTNATPSPFDSPSPALAIAARAGAHYRQRIAGATETPVESYAESLARFAGAQLQALQNLDYVKV